MDDIHALLKSFAIADVLEKAVMSDEADGTEGHQNPVSRASKDPNNSRIQQRSKEAKNLNAKSNPQYPASRPPSAQEAGSFSTIDWEARSGTKIDGQTGSKRKSTVGNTKDDIDWESVGKYELTGASPAFNPDQSAIAGTPAHEASIKGYNQNLINAARANPGESVTESAGVKRVQFPSNTARRLSNTPAVMGSGIDEDSYDEMLDAYQLLTPEQREMFTGMQRPRVDTKNKPKDKRILAQYDANKADDAIADPSMKTRTFSADADVWDQLVADRAAEDTNVEGQRTFRATGQDGATLEDLLRQNNPNFDSFLAGITRRADELEANNKPKMYKMSDLDRKTQFLARDIINRMAEKGKINPDNVSAYYNEFPQSVMDEIRSSKDKSTYRKLQNGKISVDDPSVTPEMKAKYDKWRLNPNYKESEEEKQAYIDRGNEELRASGLHPDTYNAQPKSLEQYQGILDATKRFYETPFAQRAQESMMNRDMLADIEGQLNDPSISSENRARLEQMRQELIRAIGDENSQGSTITYFKDGQAIKPTADNPVIRNSSGEPMLRDEEVLMDTGNEGFMARLGDLNQMTREQNPDIELPDDLIQPNPSYYAEQNTIDRRKGRTNQYAREMRDQIDRENAKYKQKVGSKNNDTEKSAREDHGRQYPTMESLLAGFMIKSLQVKGQTVPDELLKMGWRDNDEAYDDYMFALDQLDNSPSVQNNPRLRDRYRQIVADLGREVFPKSIEGLPDEDWDFLIDREHRYRTTPADAEIAEAEYAEAPQPMSNLSPEDAQYMRAFAKDMNRNMRRIPQAGVDPDAVSANSARPRRKMIIASEIPKDLPGTAPELDRHAPRRLTSEKAKALMDKLAEKESGSGGTPGPAPEAPPAPSTDNKPASAPKDESKPKTDNKPASAPKEEKKDESKPKRQSRLEEHDEELKTDSFPVQPKNGQAKLPGYEDKQMRIDAFTKSYHEELFKASRASMADVLHGYSCREPPMHRITAMNDEDIQDHSYTDPRGSGWRVVSYGGGKNPTFPKEIKEVSEPVTKTEINTKVQKAKSRNHSLNKGGNPLSIENMENLLVKAMQANMQMPDSKSIEAQHYEDQVFGSPEKRKEFETKQNELRDMVNNYSQPSKEFDPDDFDFPRTQEELDAQEEMWRKRRERDDEIRRRTQEAFRSKYGFNYYPYNDKELDKLHRWNYIDLEDIEEWKYDNPGKPLPKHLEPEERKWMREGFDWEDDDL